MLQSSFARFFTLFRWKVLILRSEADIRQYIRLKQLMFRILEDQSYGFSVHEEEICLPRYPALQNKYVPLSVGSIR